MEFRAGGLLSSRSSVGRSIASPGYPSQAPPPFPSAFVFLFLCLAFLFLVLIALWFGIIIFLVVYCLTFSIIILSRVEDFEFRQGFVDAIKFADATKWHGLGEPEPCKVWGWQFCVCADRHKKRLSRAPCGSRIGVKRIGVKRIGVKPDNGSGPPSA